MRAVVVTEFGGPDVMALRDLPDLSPGPQQVLVDVEFSDVGTLDRLVRSGWGEGYFDVQLPYVPGDGAGGVVRAVGPDVEESWIGRRVVGGTGPRGDNGLTTAPTGGYADSALIDVRSMVPVPEGLPLSTATALVNDGPTSQLLLEVTDLGPADTVLVLSAAGAGGMLLVQLAASRGATVLAAARGADKVEALRGLGVEHVIDYGPDGWVEEAKRVAPGGMSVVFDGAGSTLGGEGIGLVADGGRVVSYGSSAGEFAQPDRDALLQRGVRFWGLTDLPPLTPEGRNALLSKAFTSAVAGEARPVVTLVEVADAARAHRALEDRTAVGKTLLRQPTIHRNAHADAVLERGQVADAG